MFRKQSAWYQDPEAYYPVDDLALPFSDYIHRSKELIQRTRQDLDAHPSLVLNANAPFELLPSTPLPKRGILLLHGLLDSSFIMKDLAKHFHGQGFLVRAITLPGHGLIPGALLNVQYEDWLKAVHYGVMSLRKEVEEVFIAGFSTGASLAVHYAETHSNIKGIIMLSPAFQIYSKIAFTANWHRLISHRYPKAAWAYLAPENDYAKYQSIPFNAVYQVYRLTKALKKMSKKFRTPLFIAACQDDRTVNTRASLRFFMEHSHPQNHFILYTRKKRLKYKDKRIIIRNSYYPKLQVENFSHVAIPVAPNNPHYGKHGDCEYASHLDVDDLMYGTTHKMDEWLYDKLFKLKIVNTRHHRLSFNPDFDFLIHEIDRFIHHIS